MVKGADCRGKGKIRYIAKVRGYGSTCTREGAEGRWERGKNISGERRVQGMKQERKRRVDSRPGLKKPQQVWVKGGWILEEPLKV